MWSSVVVLSTNHTFPSYPFPMATRPVFATDARRILIVEDEFIIAENIRSTLKRLGYQPVAAVDNLVAIREILRTREVDLVLLDINLGGAHTGVDIAQVLRAEYDVPFVFISSYADDATLAEVNTVRPYGYVVKPFTEKEIKVALQLAFYQIELEAISRQEQQKQWLLDIAHGIAAVRLLSDLPGLVCAPLRAGLTFDAVDILRLEKPETYRCVFFDGLHLKPELIERQLHRVYQLNREDLGVSARRQTGPTPLSPHQSGELGTKMREFRYQYALVVPLEVSGTHLGLLVFYNKETAFDPRRTALYAGVGDLLGIALHNIGANEQLLLRERRKELGIQLSGIFMKNDGWPLKLRGLQRLGRDFPVCDLLYLHHVPPGVDLPARAFYRSARRDYQALPEDRLRGLLHLSDTRFEALEAALGDQSARILSLEATEGNTSELFTRLADHFQLRQALHLPMPLRSHPGFGLLLFSKRSDAYSEEALADFAGMARSVAAAIDTQLAYAEVERLSGQLEQENQYLQEAINNTYAPGFIIGESLPMQLAMEKVRQVAPTDTTVLVTGETGTGKELIARAVHEQSDRAKRALIKVNCAAFPTNLIESELFGHEKGAFTGATSRREGKFEVADGGTIFLDEIGELSLESQSKLLRILQEKEFERVGGNETIRPDVRIVAATNRDLKAAVDERRFRIDLYYRLHVFPILLPPLREREGDIELLAEYFLRKYTKRLGKPATTFSATALRILRAYPFPGNVRELEHLIERAVITSTGNRLTEADFAGLGGGTAVAIVDDVFVPQTLADRERAHILATLKHTKGRVRGSTGAAQLLDIKPTTLEARMKKLGIKKRFL